MSKPTGPPPLRSLLFFKQWEQPLDLLLTLAMVEISAGNGRSIWPSIETLSRYTRRSDRHVQRLIHGYRDPRVGRREGFRDRGILTAIAPSRCGSHGTTATYHFS